MRFFSSICGFLLFVAGFLFLPSLGQAQSTSSESTLSDTSGTGYIKFEMDSAVDSLYVVVRYQYRDARHIANGDTVGLPAGNRHLAVVTEGARDVYFEASVRAGVQDTLSVPLASLESKEQYLQESSYPVLDRGVNLIVVTDRDSRIFVDGEPRGTGIARLNVSEPEVVVETVHPEAGRTRRRVSVQQFPPRLIRAVLYNKPSRSLVRKGSVIPGLAQVHKGREIEGYALFTGFVLSVAGGVYQHRVFEGRNQKYERVRGFYEDATRSEEARTLGRKAERLYDSARGPYVRRNVLLGVATGVFLYSVLEAWLNHPPGGYRTPLSKRIRIDPILSTRKKGVRLALHF